MIALALLTVAAAATGPVTMSQAETDFRKAAMQTCPEVLALGRGFFADDARLAAAGLTVSPLLRNLIGTPGFPVGATGEHVVITLADNVGTRRNGPACTVSARPSTETAAMRDRFFATFNPTEKQVKDVQKNRDVAVIRRPRDGGTGHLIGFWSLGVYVERLGQ